MTAATAIASEPGLKLETLIDDFLKEGTTGGLVKKTTIGDKTDLCEFVTIVGNKQIRTYTPDDGEKYKKVLQSVPAQRKVDPFKGLNIAQAARKAEELDPERKEIRRLHVDTINDKLGAIRRFFEWANRHKKNVTNPVERLRIKASKRAKSAKVKKRYPLAVGQLQTIFNGPVYTGCKSHNHWKQNGNLVLRDSARFWAPLIALYSGMRLGEIIQLRTSDVKTEAGIFFFDITTLLIEDDDAEDKSLKNDNSLREIPVHPMLLTLGFAQLVEARRRQGSTRIFPDYDRSPTDDSWSTDRSQAATRLNCVWSIRTKLQMQGKKRDLALFNLAIDSKLCGCDVVAVSVDDVAPSGYSMDRAAIRQKKTGRPVRFKLTDQPRLALDEYLRLTGRKTSQFLFAGRIGLDPAKSGTHSLLRTKAVLIYRRTGNLRAMQLLLGHSKIESIVRYLGIEVDDAIEIAEKIDI